MTNHEIGPASTHAVSRKQPPEESIAQVLNNALSSMSSSAASRSCVSTDKHDLYADIASLCKVNEIAIIKRHVNRRTGRRSF